MDDERAPDINRGPTRPLTERAARMAARAALTDRRARFDERFEAIERAESRRRRRERLLDRATVVGLLLGAPLVGWWLASLLGVPPGTGIGVGIPVGVVAVLVRRWLRGYAAGRGATAWDWQRRRHVVHGRPSRAVQDLTGPRDRGGTSGRGGSGTR